VSFVSHLANDVAVEREPRLRHDGARLRAGGTVYDLCRKHPRVPADHSCELALANGSNRWPSRARTLAREGVGIWVLDPDEIWLDRGDRVAVTLAVNGSSLRLEGRVAWLDAVPHASLHVGVHFDGAGYAPTVSFHAWVERQFQVHREESCRLAGELAWRREASVRELQDALNLQERNGGFLTDILLARRARALASPIVGQSA